MRTALTILTLLFALSTFSRAQVIHVPGDQPTIQDGLNVANFGDTVLVAPGFYYENITWPETNGIKLISEGDTSNTFIDGDQAGIVVNIQGDQSLNLIDSSTVIQNFTLRNGRAFGSGGLRISEASPTILDCRITKNLSVGQTCNGAGLNISLSKSLIKNCTVDYNTGTAGTKWNYGGGVALTGCNGVKLEDVVISNNLLDSSEWTYGGGVYVRLSQNVVMENVDIHSNHLVSSSWCYGGGIKVEEDSQLALLNVKIRNNTAADNATWYIGMGIHMDWNSNLSADGLIVSGNISGTGGNHHDGFGIYFDDSTFDIQNALIVENHTMLGDLDCTYLGTVYMASGCSGTFRHCTIANNGSLSGEPVYGGSVWGWGSTLVNCILWNPTTEYELYPNGHQATYSNVFGGHVGTGNIDADPMFIGNGDYRLQTFSPCINSGTIATAPDFDIEGNPRPMPVGTYPDLGAYEDDNPSTSIEENKTQSGINIYPNPSSGHIRIGMEPQQIEAVEVYNSQGQMVLSIREPKTPNLDLSSFSSGLYSIRILPTNGKAVIEKLILAN